MSGIFLKCRHGEFLSECGPCRTEQTDIEAFTAGFERVDLYLLAAAFGVEIDSVHTAVGMTGTLYRQRA